MKILFTILTTIIFFPLQAKDGSGAPDIQGVTISSLLDSSEHYKLRNPQRALEFANAILSQYPYKGNEKAHIQALLNSANCQKMLSQKELALASAQQAIGLSTQYGDSELIVKSYFMKGTVYGEYDDQDSAMYYYQEVIRRHHPGIEPYFVSSAYTNVGLVYNGTGHLDKAEEYLLKGYALAQKDAYAKIFALAAVISFYVNQQNPKYLSYLDTLASSDFYKKASPESFMAHFDAFLQLEDATDEEKEKTLREVYQYGLNHTSMVNQVGYGMRLYEHLAKVKKFEEAHQLLLVLYDKSVLAKHGPHLSGVVRALYNNSKDRGHMPDALKYLERHSELRDSLLSEENRNRIAELNIQFETAQKDREIEQQNIRLEQEERNRRLLLALTALLMALAVVVFLFFRNRARSARRIAEQQKVIHLQETEHLQKEKKLAELTASLETQEKERNRIARDLHDGIGSMMSGISSQLEHLRSRPGIAAGFQAQLASLREMIKEASAELRRTSYELMPAKLLREGFEPAIRDLCFTLLVKNRIEPALEINADLTLLNPQQQLSLYRIVQELLNNIVRHAEASQVLIQFTKVDEGVSLVIEDNGKGFDVLTSTRDGGLGLGSLKNRVSLINGFLDIASAPGQGTTVTVNFPLRLANGHGMNEAL